MTTSEILKHSSKDKSDCCVICLGCQAGVGPEAFLRVYSTMPVTSILKTRAPSFANSAASGLPTTSDLFD